MYLSKVKYCVMNHKPRNYFSVDLGVCPSQKAGYFTFRLDRTRRNIWGNSSRAMLEDLISHITALKSVYPVGGVTIYIEPSCYPTEKELALLDPKWKVSIGVHPKKMHELI